MTADPRLESLSSWLEAVLDTPFTLEPASEDASFRRYFRVTSQQVGPGKTWIAMDAPPVQESCGPFVEITRAMRELGLNTPEVLAEDLDRGFLLLTDFGDRQYLQQLEVNSVQTLYGDALQALLCLQEARTGTQLPTYDEKLLREEMGLFHDWYLQKHLGLKLSSDEQNILQQGFDLLVANALEQPVVWVHRDFHSRNLMLVDEQNPGILDFQDSVQGPVTYDLVSLLRDCYIDWPTEQVTGWALNYRLQLRDRGLLGAGVTEETFLRWFDLMGAQRHLKAIGIFARLFHRDGKSGYLKDIPRTFSYLLAETEAYSDLSSFHHLLENRIKGKIT